jgi:MFS family permease
MRHRDFRLFILGQVVSLTGTWMQNLAQSWLVWRLTQSAALVGLVGFASHLPILLLGPLGGLAADRYPRRRIVLVTQVLFLVQASCFAALALTDRVSVPLIVILALAWGLINAFDIPARQSLYIHLVGKDDLLSAISLNSVTFNSARVVGPSVAGFLVAALGEGLCFLLNAVTFLPVIGSLLLMRVVEPAREAASAPLRHLREGFQYAWRNHEIRGLLGLTAAVNFAGAPAFVLAPVVADAVFGRGSQGLGILLGAFGLGAVVGTAALASRKAVGSHRTTISASALGMAAGLTL